MRLPRYTSRASAAQGSLISFLQCSILDERFSDGSSHVRLVSSCYPNNRIAGFFCESKHCTLPMEDATLITAIQFQIETLASLVRYYRKKCHQQRALLERSKLESQQHKLLRKYAHYSSVVDNCSCSQTLRKYEDLKLHAQQLKEYVHDSRSRGSEPSETVNSNGKRQMLDSHRFVDVFMSHTFIILTGESQ